MIPDPEHHMAFHTMLRDLLRSGQPIECMVVWRSAQWSSEDGTEDDLFEMFRIHGTPGKVEFWTN